MTEKERLTVEQIGALSDNDLVAAYTTADAAWEVDRRSGGWSQPTRPGGWNYSQREERNALAAEIHRRRERVTSPRGTTGGEYR